VNNLPIVTGIYYQHFSKSKRDESPAVILLHGAGGTHLHWPASLRRLVGCDVYALDLPGHGRSLGVSCGSISAYADAIVDWIAALGLEQVVVIGHSMGSAIAMTLALEGHSALMGLGLLGAGASLRVNPQVLENIAQPDTFLETVHKVVRWSFSPSTPDLFISLAEKRMIEAGSQLLRSDFLVCDAFDVTERLNQITQPTLIICGQDDRMTPIKESFLLAERIPHAQLELISAAGHMVMLEKPDQVEAILNKFLSRF
jgi:pimeloyl-ACP methyl ester carboxylesterase